MPNIKTNRRHHGGTSSKSKSKEKSRTGRRQEILGTLILLLGVLIAASGISYSAADDPVVTGKSFWELLFPLESNSIQNAVGPIGAWLAHAIVPSFMGFTSLFFVLLIFLLGYTILRKRSLVRFWIPTLNFIGIVGFTSVVFGRLSLPDVNLDLTIWAGHYGNSAALWLNNVLGWLGSWIILGIAFIIGLMLLVDRDFQHWLDRIERLWKSSLDSFHELKQKSDERPKSSTTEVITSTWEDLG